MSPSGSERPHRLTVRTPGFHPGNPGSIPGEITTKSARLVTGVFRGVTYAAKRTRIGFAVQNDNPGAITRSRAEKLPLSFF